jgi:hypothetical protein
VVIVVGERRCVAWTLPLASVWLRDSVRGVKKICVAANVPSASDSGQRRTFGALTLEMDAGRLH